MAINDIVQYTSGFLPCIFTVYPSPYSCMARWYYHIIDIISNTILVTMYYYSGYVGL